jgi:predicted alpha/beta-fold hydrolase
MSNVRIPNFEPHPLLRGGHLQTVAGRYWPGRRSSFLSTYHEVDLEDGDRLAVLESTPRGWRDGGPMALLVHGLAGCARTGYVVRMTTRFLGMGLRVARMNLRGAGLGFGLARGTYHAGRTNDLRAVVEWMAGRGNGSPIALVGFSLGGNLVLKLAAEAAEQPLDGLDCVLAANPPLDLVACAKHIRRPENRIYDRNFVRALQAQVDRLHALFPELGSVGPTRARSLYEFDDLYTAPRNGFSGAGEYYERCSAGPMLSRIRVPGLVVHAADDPFIPAESFHRVSFPHRLALELISSGGHLGYISRTSWGGDRRWLDARLAAWLADHWAGIVREGTEADCHDRDTFDARPGGHGYHVRPQVQ